jgi:hypothetical protein
MFRQHPWPHPPTAPPASNAFCTGRASASSSPSRSPVNYSAQVQDPKDGERDRPHKCRIEYRVDGTSAARRSQFPPPSRRGQEPSDAGALGPVSSPPCNDLVPTLPPQDQKRPGPPHRSEKALVKLPFDGAPPGTRTPDPLIKSGDAAPTTLPPPAAASLDRRTAAPQTESVGSDDRRTRRLRASPEIRWCPALCRRMLSHDE